MEPSQTARQSCLTKRNNYINLFITQIVISFSVNLLADLVPSLNALSFCCDLIVVLFALLLLLNTKQVLNAKRLPVMLLMVAVLLLFDITFLFIYGTDFFLFIWGIRNQYRFIVYFFAAAVFLSLRDMKYIFKVLDAFLVINIGVIFIQFFVLNYSGDYLGGLFGVERGCNSILNIFLVVEFCSCLSRWLNKNLDTKYFVLIFIACFMWAAMAELKFFYIEAVVALLTLVLISKKNLNRKLKIVLITSLVLIVSAYALTLLFPYYANFFTIDSMMSYFTNVSLGYGGFNRSNAIQIVSESIFGNDPYKIAFGIGTGNAEFSTSFSMFTSSFYQMYSLLMYDSYFHAFIFIERGYFGLAWYCLFILVPVFSCLRQLRLAQGFNKACLELCVAIGVCLLMTIIYDTGLRTAASGYLAFMILAIPYMNSKELACDKTNRNVSDKGY